MTETQSTTTEAERTHGTDAPRHNDVEVFDANRASAPHSGDAMNGGERRESNFRDSDLTNTTLRNNNLSDADLNDSNLRTADRTDTGTLPGTAAQGTNWSTILMVIAIILVIILLGNWLF